MDHCEMNASKFYKIQTFFVKNLTTRKIKIKKQLIIHVLVSRYFFGFFTISKSDRRSVR